MYEIILDVVWLEDAFHVWTSHGLAKKKKKIKWLKSQGEPSEGGRVDGSSPNIDKFVKNRIK